MSAPWIVLSGRPSFEESDLIHRQADRINALCDEVRELVEEVRWLEDGNRKLNERFWHQRADYEDETTRRIEAAIKLCREKLHASYAEANRLRNELDARTRP